ncbi:MAG: DsrE family protein [Chloroflexota bacterium]
MSSNGNNKTVVICNNADTGTFPTLIMSTSAIALGDDVITFFCPGGASALVKGELEKLQGKKGMPDPVDLYDTLVEQGGRVILCELAIEAKGIKKEDLRQGVEILSAPAFLMESEGAHLSLTF